MAGSIVFLNGTPSSGKSRLARALRDASPEPVFYQSFDEFRLSIAARFWIGARAVERLFVPMLDAYLVTLREVAVRGVPVIAESVMTSTTQARYDELFGDLDPLLVGVLCPLEIVWAREAARTDRLNGPHEVTAQDVESVHRRDYAMTVDTSLEDTATSVARILETWTGRR